MKKYLITSEDIYTQDKEIFTKKLTQCLRNHLPEYALYRDKSNAEYASLAEEFLNVCSAFSSLKGFLHDDIELAYRLKAYGVHLPSNRFEDIQKAKDLGLKVIISTHTQEEVLKAEKLGVEYVTYSPIFYTPDKGEVKGVENLKELLLTCKIKIFALGGIVSEKEVNEVDKTTVYGFASIRYFA